MPDAAKEQLTYAVDFIKGDWDKAVYLGNPHVDNLMTALQSLGAEHWALRRRMMVIEKFLDQNHVALKQAIESYEPTPEERAAWEKERDEYINRVFGVLTRATGPVSGAVPTALVPPLNGNKT